MTPTPSPSPTPTALEPCPHCGHETAPKLGNSFDLYPEIEDAGNAMTFAVHCDASQPGGPGGCGSMGGFKETEAEAIAAWNRRSSESASKEAGAVKVPEGYALIPLEVPEAVRLAQPIDPCHPQFVAGFWAGHKAGRARSASSGGSD